MAKIIRQNRGSDLMPKEREAIEIVEGIVKSQIEADECGLSNNDFKHEIRALQTVLNMLKEKDKEIEEYKRIIAAGIINAEKDKLVQEKNKEIEKKDKQIDLMAIRILVKIIGDYPCTYKESCTKSDEKYRDLKCKECIKQYFERKSEE